MSYVKEIEAIIDAGLNEATTKALYQLLTDRFHEVCGGAGTEEFRIKVAELRKNERGYFHDIIDEVCSEFPLPVEINWRTLKYEPQRIEWCDICGNFFYDVSRNGRMSACEGECIAEYKRRKRAGGDILFPYYNRQPEIVLVDMQPAPEDKYGNALLNEMEMQRWKDF